MDIFYDILNMAVKSEDFVVEVNFKISGMGELGSSVTLYKTLEFDYVDVDIVPFEELSKEQVISWLFNEEYTENDLISELQAEFDKSQKVYKLPSSW